MGSAVDDCSALKCRPRHLCRPGTSAGMMPKVWNSGDITPILLLIASSPFLSALARKKLRGSPIGGGVTRLQTTLGSSSQRRRPLSESLEHLVAAAHPFFAGSPLETRQSLIVRPSWLSEGVQLRMKSLERRSGSSCHLLNAGRGTT